jgi:hypothetical protein
MDSRTRRGARMAVGMRSEVPSVLVVVWLFIGGVSPVYAYIDPGSGAMLFQLLAAVFVGALYYVFRAWKRIRAFVSNLFGEKRRASSPPEDERE